MNIWVFNKPSIPKSSIEFIYSSLIKGISRFGWGYFDGADLFKIKEKKWSELVKDEKECYSKTNFLLDVKKNDWIVHISVPSYGMCTAAQVSNTYQFEQIDTPIGDFRHTLGIDIESLITFDRNNKNVLPYISRRLKLQGHYWRIRAIEEFEKSIKNLKSNTSTNNNTPHGLFYLKEDIKPHLSAIALLIHKNHPGKKLEAFFEIIFNNIPNVNYVKNNGSGWKSDNGADLIVHYTTGFPLSGLQKEEKLVVQIKSYDGLMKNNEAVKQIKVAIETYGADAGLIITTAKVSKEIQEQIENLSFEINKPIAILDCENVASFVLKNANEQLLGI